MILLKCKMCGGDIQAAENQAYGTCDSCGSTMTLPTVSDEHRANLHNRANHYRQQNEFDKALATYESILAEDNNDAEAHWGVVLSKYGIEYVEDPRTHDRIPTCHRVQNNPILSDLDYKAALKSSTDEYTLSLYEQEAKKIAEIQKSILAISSKEEPYDVFICYKETGATGQRTVDSTLAQDIYYQLDKEGLRVFFSRITLEDKLGVEYEPYIFAALNSAKVMLVVGTKSENFNAVWVKNEWSRFAALAKENRDKIIIPCYRDMDAYDLPEELSMFQSQDMGKIGFIQDLVRGIKKITDIVHSNVKNNPYEKERENAEVANREHQSRIEKLRALAQRAQYNDDISETIKYYNELSSLLNYSDNEVLFYKDYYTILSTVSTDYNSIVDSLKAFNKLFLFRFDEISLINNTEKRTNEANQLITFYIETLKRLSIKRRPSFDRRCLNLKYEEARIYYCSMPQYEESVCEIADKIFSSAELKNSNWKDLYRYLVLNFRMRKKHGVINNRLGTDETNKLCVYAENRIKNGASYYKLLLFFGFFMAAFVALLIDVARGASNGEEMVIFIVGGIIASFLCFIFGGIKWNVNRKYQQQAKNMIIIDEYESLMTYKL